MPSQARLRAAGLWAQVVSTTGLIVGLSRRFGAPNDTKAQREAQETPRCCERHAG